MFRKLLIANRGEIALRIARGCRAVGVSPVAAFSEADRDAPWLDAADERVCIGPARAEDSYLDATAVLQAAEQHDCQAIHPGYGFLAENAVLAARCEQQGIAFVGPGAGAIRLMGDKVEAKRTMRSAGVPTIPGSEGIVADLDEALACAGEIGYPVLLKAAAGGGGRGMRRCDDPRRLRSAFGEARLEADKAFGDPTLYLERLITGGRHVEMQVLCDQYGAALHLGERECSIQRHHQKLVEESPSPVMDSGTRARLGELVARAAAGFGYRNAGTVEFLRSPEGDYLFMEMNTRLQVEHPVTEMITGVDLVTEQIRIAAGHRLGRTQDEVRFEGHAVEFRINAEDPEAAFRPDPGEITAVELPEIADPRIRVRWDSAVRTGYRISPHYDSMIGKLIVHGPDRSTALEGARAALAGLRIEGVRTTLVLHRRVVEETEFVEGRYDVDFLERSGLLRQRR
jgi:acetyl-CoA carboxylase biotin carboxylase subunit